MHIIVWRPFVPSSSLEPPAMSTSRPIDVTDVSGWHATAFATYPLVRSTSALKRWCSRASATSIGMPVVQHSPTRPFGWPSERYSGRRRTCPPIPERGLFFGLWSATADDDVWLTTPVSTCVYISRPFAIFSHTLARSAPQRRPAAFTHSCTSASTASASSALSASFIRRAISRISVCRSTARRADMFRLSCDIPSSASVCTAESRGGSYISCLLRASSTACALDVPEVSSAATQLRSPNRPSGGDSNMGSSAMHIRPPMSSAARSASVKMYALRDS